MNSGIYIIKNKINEKVYVGSSINLKNRKRSHFIQLKNNKHINQHLQNAWNKYGVDGFSFEIVEFCEREFLREREIYNIEKFNSIINGYNIMEVDENHFIHSKSTKLKIGSKSKIKKLSKETKEKIRKSVKASWENNLERKEKLIKRNKSRIGLFKQTEEVKRKISKKKKGISIWSEEQKKEMSKERKLNPVKLSEKGKERIKKSNKERVITKETKEKMRLSKLGKPSVRKGSKCSEETKEKMKKSYKNYIENNREEFLKRYETRRNNKKLKSSSV